MFTYFSDLITLSDISQTRSKQFLPRGLLAVKTKVERENLNELDLYPYVL
jgi:hypothetical protein